MTTTGNGDLYGFTGRLLRVDLTSGTTSTETVSEHDMKAFLGGVGFSTKLLYNELPTGVDPLGSGNKLVFGCGPLTGTRAPGSGSIEICFKSPLTGIWGESRSGSDWGGALKKAGYDYLVVEGKADGWKYLVIDNDNVEIRPATQSAGKTISEKESQIRQELDGEFEIASIGPAGENLVRYASVMFGARAAGRCGAGAVMGSKNLLAIAVRGNGQIRVADPDRFLSLCREYHEKILASTGKDGMSIDGTTGDMVNNDNLGDIPTKNWRSNSWGKGEEFYQHFKTTNLIRSRPCYKGCVLRCGRIARVEGGKWETPEHEGSQYESLAAFTFFVLNEDMDAAVHATHLCNEYGLDTISAGAVIAFAMDCYEQGILPDEEADGLELNWGNTDVMVDLVHKIARREGIGRVLGQGVARASQIIGKGSQESAIHGKGLEGPAHDARSGKALAVMYGLSNRGMCHIHPLEGMAYDSLKNDFGLIPFGVPDPNTLDRFDESGKGTICKSLQDFGIIPDIVGICKFHAYNGLGPVEMANLVSSLTGWEMDGEELLRIGERVYNLQRMFNVREGVRRADDMLPERCFRMPEFGKYSSVNECAITSYDAMMNECYEARGWDRDTGIPTKQTLHRLGLEGEFDFSP